MEAEKRREEIMQLLNEKGKASIAELSQMFNVTMQTIRRDVDELVANEGIIKRHGQIIKQKNMFEPYFIQRLLISADEKENIGKQAAELIQDNDTIAFDGTTTVYMTTKSLSKQQNLTLFINNIFYLNELSEKINHNKLLGKVIFLGGDMDLDTLSSYGTFLHNQLEGLYFDKVFIGAGGVSIEHGLTAYSVSTGNFAEKLMKRANEVILLTTHNKIDNRTLYKFGSFEKVTKIVTTIPPPNHEWDSFLSQHNIEWFNINNRVLTNEALS